MINAFLELYSIEKDSENDKTNIRVMLPGYAKEEIELKAHKIDNEYMLEINLPRPLKLFNVDDNDDTMEMYSTHVNSFSIAVEYTTFVNIKHGTIHLDYGILRISIPNCVVENTISLKID